MAFSLTDFLDPSILFGSGGAGILGFVGGHIKSRNGRVANLEREVAACRKRDADVTILKAGMRILFGKVQREHPDSVELRMFGDLLARRLGPTPETSLEFEEILRRLDEIDEEGENERH